MGLQWKWMNVMREMRPTLCLSCSLNLWWWVPAILWNPNVSCFFCCRVQQGCPWSPPMSCMTHWSASSHCSIDCPRGTSWPTAIIVNIRLTCCSMGFITVGHSPTQTGGREDLCHQGHPYLTWPLHRTSSNVLSIWVGPVSSGVLPKIGCAWCPVGPSHRLGQGHTTAWWFSVDPWLGMRGKGWLEMV